MEKKESAGRPEGTNKLGQNDPIRASAAIADQLSIGEKTVRRAAEFTLAVDKIISVTGIPRAYKGSYDVYKLCSIVTVYLSFLRF